MFIKAILLSSESLWGSMGSLWGSMGSLWGSMGSPWGSMGYYGVLWGKKTHPFLLCSLLGLYYVNHMVRLSFGDLCKPPATFCANCQINYFHLDKSPVDKNYEVTL